MWWLIVYVYVGRYMYVQYLLQGLRLTGPPLAWSRRSLATTLQMKQSKYALSSRLGSKSMYVLLGCVIQGQYPNPEPCFWGAYLVQGTMAGRRT